MRVWKTLKYRKLAVGFCSNCVSHHYTRRDGDACLWKKKHFPSSLVYIFIFIIRKFIMRKISKSRMDDDVVSSTNGSLLNDDRTGSPNNDVNEKDAGSDEDGTNANSEENEGSDVDNAKEASKKSKGRGRTRKSGKDNNEKADGSDDDTNANSDANDEDDKDSDYGSKKKEKTPKKATPKSKAKKRKSGKEKAVEEEYEVEKVVDSKKIKGKLHYLIRWKGYSAESDTWEPENTLSCPDLISKYNDEKENSKAKSKENKKTKSKKGAKRKGKRDVSSTPAKKAKTEWDSQAADENAEYEVERILEVHHKKNGRREFLIHWKGWSNKFDSWEPEENLNCSELINKFMSKVSAAKTSDARNLRVAPETTNRFTLQAPTTGRRLSKRRGQRQRVRYDNAE